VNRLRWQPACLALLLALAGSTALAGQPPPGVRVPAWRELSAQQQRDLAPFAERWDRMPASRRALVLERYQRWSRLPADRQAQLRAGERNFERMSPTQRERMRRAFRAVRALPPDEQQRLRATWREMSPEQRRDWLGRGGPGLAPP
jgi:hypothetical protein